MSDGALAKILAQYVKDRNLTEGTAIYQGHLWKDIQDQLGLFITDMNNDSEYHNAKNCENAYWQHPEEHGTPGQSPRRMDRSKERVICRLMTQAIYFANAWSKEARNNASHDDQNKEIKGIMRCTIADIYQDILTEAGCEGHWGTYYAWYVVDQISGGLTATRGAQDCERGKYKTIDLKTWPMRSKMKTWLKDNEQMKQKLAQEKIQDGCGGGTVKTKGQLQQEGEIKDDESEHKNDEELKKRMKAAITPILGKLKHAMKQEEITLKASTGPAPTYDSVDDADEQKGDEIDHEMKQAIEDAGEDLKKVIVIPASATPATAATGTAENRPSTEPTDEVCVRTGEYFPPGCNIVTGGEGRDIHAATEL
ncbi:hypothetical protein AK88_05561 [Plasmodium fragile]|uniref:Uncharacterized protein n=1 Tax=Plasmodium fragile TaxID=5857 RepID=A0A0D9QCV5_PLAFR|nr:uncharacterized protein AK88_05561 [Plasmodium fragile]KJP84809.1 hypothetical protein AK88_05561 [Plasmodium fragile]